MQACDFRIRHCLGAAKPVQPSLAYLRLDCSFSRRTTSTMIREYRFGSKVTHYVDGYLMSWTIQRKPRSTGNSTETPGHSIAQVLVRSDPWPGQGRLLGITR